MLDTTPEITIDTADYDEESGLWSVYCAIVWPDRSARGPHTVAGPGDLTEADLKTAIAAQYG